MTMKILGAFLIFCGCGSFGFSMAAAYRSRQQTLEQALRALEWMHGELSFRMPELAGLCRSTAEVVSGPVRELLRELARELDRQAEPDAAACMKAVLNRQTLPGELALVFMELGENLAGFDLPGQLRGLEQAQLHLRQQLDRIRAQRENRIRSYETLGLCTGASLAILLI